MNYETDFTIKGVKVGELTREQCDWAILNLDEMVETLSPDVKYGVRMALIRRQNDVASYGDDWRTGMQIGGGTG